MEVDPACVNKAIPEKEKRMLMGLFPEMDPAFLEEMSFEDNPDWLNKTIDHLLEGRYRRRVKVKEHRSFQEIVESQYQYLVGLLPDADISYLRRKCENMRGSCHLFEEFVAHALEYRDYPTLKESLKRKKTKEMQTMYTKQFNVKDFLDIFPNPLQYFTQKRKGSKENYSLAISYLNKRYSTIRRTDISSVYRREEFNLTRTCKILDKFPYKMKAKRVVDSNAQAPIVANIPFMQEVAFIENEHLINEYLTKKEAARKAAYQKAKVTGSLKECGCCFADDVLPEDIVSCPQGHLFCKDCVQRGTGTQIAEGKTRFQCFEDCSSEFSLKTLQSILKPVIFSRLLHRQQLEEVQAAGIEGLETCPFCQFATIPAEGDKVFHCLNPECMKNTCRKCKNPDHVPLSCEEVEESKEVEMRTYIENKMTEALIRICYQCKKPFIKEDGCNKMTCPCGALMCYLCRQPIEDYSHFSPAMSVEKNKSFAINLPLNDQLEKFISCTSHDVPEVAELALLDGCEKLFLLAQDVEDFICFLFCSRYLEYSSVCPLFTNNDDLHVTVVKEEAKKAKREVLMKNPGCRLKNDPTKVLPEPVQKQPK